MIRTVAHSEDRYIYVFVLLTLAFLPIRLLAQDEADFYPPSIFPDRIILSLTQDPSHEMGINWRTSTESEHSYVEYGKASASPNIRLAVKSKAGELEPLETEHGLVHYHSVILDALNPNTQYMYRVGDSTELGWSEWSHFRTADREPSGFSFIYLGDAQNNLKSMWSRAVRASFSTKPDADFIFHAGDLIDHADRDREWGEWFYGGGWIFRCLPSIACTGNHEYSRDPDRMHQISKYWGPTFSLPRNGPKGMDETVYYIDYQNTRFISLNTELYLTEKEAAQRQLRWLKSTLKNHDQKWTVVMMHHPIYSSKAGRDNMHMRNDMQPLFEKYDVDLVLQGHDHTYGRGTNMPLGEGQNILDGPMYVVSVSGPKMYDLSLEEWMHRGASDAQLYQVVEIDRAKLVFKAYLVTGELYDSFELHKMSDGKSIFVDATPADQPELLEVPELIRQKYTAGEWKMFKERFAKYKARKKAERRQGG
ncbi:MAG: metallophosphoesterase family protein [Saprospiraceae bacterium]|nr:metallophosphoesterase family protein [Saprospiraceae bacterium]